MSAASRRGRARILGLLSVPSPPVPDGPEDVERAVARAMWAGDIDTLHRIAGCVCCCAEHTHTTGCPAYVWGGCRGQGTLTREEVRGWEEHYARHHGLTREQFRGWAA